jgi:hypothetical protein
MEGEGDWLRLQPAALCNQPESGLGEGRGEMGWEWKWERKGTGERGRGGRCSRWYACPPGRIPSLSGQALSGWLDWLVRGSERRRWGDKRREEGEREGNAGGVFSAGFWQAGGCRFRGGRPSWENQQQKRQAISQLSSRAGVTNGALHAQA